MTAQPHIPWPDGKRFAFTIFDDTDHQTLENVPPVYDFLADLGLRTTKSVWPLNGSGQPAIGGLTAEHPDNLAWLKQLQARGFEIALHNATWETSRRADTLRGLDRFRELFGHEPVAFANHAGCREGLYWGDRRLSGWNRLGYNLLTLGRNRGRFQGHEQGSPLFWGDACRERITFVRNFVFRDINTLAACPSMPYHDPDRPYVRYWFAASEGPDVGSFNKTLSEANQDRLSAAGGACIMYTHLASGFYVDGKLNTRFSELLERLAGAGGWFVPVSELLEFLLRRNGHYEISATERKRLERRWLRDKLWIGGSS